MIEKRIKFMTSGQLMSFCNICQKMKSDIDVTDITNRNFGTYVHKTRASDASGRDR